MWLARITTLVFVKLTQQLLWVLPVLVTASHFLKNRIDYYGIQGMPCKDDHGNNIVKAPPDLNFKKKNMNRGIVTKELPEKEDNFLN